MHRAQIFLISSVPTTDPSDPTSGRPLLAAADLPGHRITPETSDPASINSTVQAPSTPIHRRSPPSPSPCRRPPPAVPCRPRRRRSSHAVVGAGEDPIRKNPCSTVADGEDGKLHLAREGGHSHNRIVHAADMTGREIERALLKAIDDDPNIILFGHHFVIDLLTTQDDDEIYCHGVDALNAETQQVVRFISKVTLLASGGAGHIYPTTTNPPVATGDGIAMAHRAQAVISNMEFVQFHPTALADEGLPTNSGSSSFS